MRINFYSIVMSIVVSGILLLLLCFVRRKVYAIQLFGIKTISALYLLCLIRFLFPVDLPFSESIALPVFFHDFYKRLCLNTYSFGKMEFRLINSLVFVWLVIAGMRVLHFVMIYFVGKRKLIQTCRPLSMNYQPIVNEIEQESGVFFKVKILSTDQVSGPMGVGIIDKVILLPDVEYNESELYYILLHEYMHFYNKDLLIKLLVHVYSCLFWWNPLSYLLEKDLAQILEIKCDHSVANLVGENRTADYLQSIIAVLKKRTQQPCRESAVNPMTMSLLGNQTVELTERFSIMVDAHKMKKKGRRLQRFVITIVLCFFASSYLIIFQCEFTPPVSDIITDESTYEITAEEYYITLEGDGTYTLRNNSGYAQEISEEHAKIMLKQNFRLLE